VLALSILVAGCSDDGEMSLGAETVQPDESEIAREMTRLIKEISLERAADGGVVKRFNQVKSLGCFDATFTISDNLSPKLARGLFAKPASYPARLRFANASSDDDSEKDLRGVSVKIPRIDDADLTGGKTMVLDFLFNSYPALFVATPQDFLSFIEATAKGRRWAFFITHPGTLWMLLKARDIPASPFDIRYWSTTPYRYGADSASAVKYSLAPCSTVTTDFPDDPDADHLTRAMAGHLQQAPACFEFMVQFQSHAELMPIEDASVIWNEDISPFETVARILIDDQEFQDADAMDDCEALSFNPWNALSDHVPIGGINRVRKKMYNDVAKFRAKQNSGT
jgi:catalase